MQNNTAAFIAGNKGIIKSSYVVFKSLFEHNKNIDGFVCLPKDSYTDAEVANLKSIGVKFLDLTEDDLFEDCISWPKECFLNFEIPNRLYDMGYNTGIKLDNDILVNNKLDLFVNANINTFKGTIHSYDRLKDIIISNHDFYQKTFSLDKEKLNKDIIMFGCLFINLKMYTSSNFWDKYKNIYYKIVSNQIHNSSIFADMGLFALTLTEYNIEYDLLDNKYNYIVSSSKHLKNKKNLDFNPVVIHYAGPKKPWNKAKFLKYITNPYNMYYRQIWLDYVNLDANKGFKSKFIKSNFYKMYIKTLLFFK